MNDDLDVVNMVQVLEDEQLLHEDAAAVLGASDSVQCTYSKGYVQRQALYACSTCPLLNNEQAGVCLACALECHEGHDLIELYTKRHFRCDCGNSKFLKETPCKLCPEKAPTNADNRYNHNFSGLYCNCARPYPDPEDSEDDLMLQCVLCEDWYHGRHLGYGKPLPDQETFEEVTCEDCCNRCTFLRTYASFCSAGQEETNEHAAVSTDIDGPVIDVESSKSDGDAGDLKGSECRLKEMVHRNAVENLESTGAVFWRFGWRRKLCTCQDCLVLYENLGVSFLIDKNDSIAAYEEQGKLLSSKSSYDKGLEALQSMNRVQQIELVHGFDELKTELKDYLKKFADNGKIVREEDIAEFFKQLQARKRQRTDGPMQYFCR